MDQSNQHQTQISMKQNKRPYNTEVGDGRRSILYLFQRKMGWTICYQEEVNII